MKRKNILGSILRESLILVVTLIYLIPIYYFIIGAFKVRIDIVKFPLAINWDMIKGVGFANFSYAFKKMKMLDALKNTGTITISALAMVIFAGSLAGFAIARVDRKLFQSFYKILIVLMVVPFIGSLIPLVIQSTQLKTYNTLLGPILIQAAWNLPFAIFLYTGFMRTIPKELEEAAYIDGCSLISTYYRIFLPLLAPVTATSCIYAGVGMWNDYLVSMSLLNGARMPTIMVGVTMFFGSRKTEYGYAFAGIILASLPIVILFLFLQKYFIKGLTAGAVKG
ncbi:MAG: carbohydrate ABC transporter permease [Clostridiales bacterium]|nr:carbohydrate ABC transporter permease [Clostridiales bacterium]